MCHLWAAVGKCGCSSAERTYLPLLLGAGELVGAAGGGCGRGGHSKLACPPQAPGGRDGRRRSGSGSLPFPMGSLLLGCSSAVFITQN